MRQRYIRDRVENILLLEGVIKAVARHRKKNPDEVFMRVKRSVLRMFSSELRQQALQHVRHRVKNDVEKRIDKRFTNIGALEDHMVDLVNEIDPRSIYEGLCRQFHTYLQNGDYASVLRVFNQKSMLPDCNVAGLMGLSDKKSYIQTVLGILKTDGPDAEAIRTAIKSCFGLTNPC